MNLLVLTPHLPWPPHQGTAIRNFNLIEGLARTHTVDLLSFVAADESLSASNPLHALCRRVAVLPQPVRPTRRRARDTLTSTLPDMALRLESPHMRAALSRWLADGDYDLVQSEGIEMAGYGEQAARTSGVCHVFDDHNCEYLLQKRNALTDMGEPKRWAAAAYSLIQWQKLVRYERGIVRRADATVAVSAADAAALRALAPAATVVVAANGIDLDFYAPAPDERSVAGAGSRRLVFTGKMDYRPNVDAVLWFARHVLPRVLEQAPDVRFQAVGRNPHPRLAELDSQPAVEITGGVDDIRPYIQQADVYVIPMRVGGGTRFKALEAMACARPIVSTRLGIEGIDVRDGVEMLLADRPEDFANALLTLLEPGNAQLRTQLATNARRCVEAHFGWPPIVESLNALYDRLCARGNRVAA